MEVTDGSDQLPSFSSDASPDSETGRGLVLLDAVADKWGVDAVTGGGKTVWFECATAADALGP